MKKIFTTILALFYFVSGVGFSYTQYDCLNNQDIVSQHECQCCCSEVLPESSKSNDNTCCDEKGAGISISNAEKENPGECCIIQHKYNQLDISSLLPNIDVTHVTNISGELYNIYPQHPQNNDGSVLTKFTDLSIHVNLPLLI